MKIVFVGTVEFSYEMLLELIKIKADIVGVVTKEKSTFNSDFYDLIPTCKQNNIKYHLTNDINSQDSIEWIKNLNPDVVFCFGWSNLIKKELLNLTKLGVIGFHPAKLPQNRGRHPLIWALALGLNETASTFFFMQEGADDGDILSQEEVSITYHDDAASLYKKIIQMAKKQVQKFVFELENNTYKRIKQNNEQANFWRKRTKDDGLICFKMHSETIYNLVRALTKPYVGAHLLYNGEEIKIWQVQVVDCEMNNIEYGKVLSIDGDSIVVKTPDSAIKILQHEFKSLPKVGEYL